MVYIAMAKKAGNLLKKAAKGLLKEVPGGELASELLTKDKTEKSAASSRIVNIYDSYDKPNKNERYVYEALYGGSRRR